MMTRKTGYDLAWLRTFCVRKITFLLLNLDTLMQSPFSFANRFKLLAL